MSIKDEDTASHIKTLAQQAATTCSAHEVRLDHIERDIKEMKDDIKAMREILSEARGSWRTLVMIGGACGTLGAFASWIFSNVSIKH